MTGRIDPFQLAAQDLADRLMVPERLYGRESEIAALVDSFERVARDGRQSLVLVSGSAFPLAPALRSTASATGSPALFGVRELVTGFPRLAAIVEPLLSVRQVMRQQFLTNPVYAGAYAFGRTGSRMTIENGRKRILRGHRKPRSEWAVLLVDHHEGYLSWADYERNQRLIADNANGKGMMVRGAVRKGEALLAGLLRCGHCGRRLLVSYNGTKGTSAAIIATRPGATRQLPPASRLALCASTRQWGARS